MWLWRSEHNYLEKELNLSSIVICYNVLHCSQKASPTLVLECYALKKSKTSHLDHSSHIEGDIMQNHEQKKK
jgi:hypothetical protein